MWVLPSTFHLRLPPFQPHTLCELLCMSKHSPVQTVVHSRRIVYLNKGYVFWAGEMSACVDGNASMWVLAYHQTFEPCVHAITPEFYITYAVKYTHADLVKCNCGKVGPWVTLVELQVTQVTQTQSMDYKIECQFYRGTKRPRPESKIHIHWSTVVIHILCSWGWLLPLEGLLLTFRLAEMDKKNENPHF